MSNKLILSFALLASATLCVAQSGATKPDPVLKEKGLRSLDKLAARSGELGLALAHGPA